jgi:gamma-glutamyltranspeptidase
MMEDGLTRRSSTCSSRAAARACVLPQAGMKHRALMGGGQAIMIDPANGMLSGASDSRKDGFALGY